MNPLLLLCLLTMPSASSSATSPTSTHTEPELGRAPEARSGLASGLVTLTGRGYAHGYRWPVQGPRRGTWRRGQRRA